MRVVATFINVSPLFTDMYVNNGLSGH